MECPSITNLGYADFSQKIHLNANQQRIPLNASFEVTMRCDLRCQHCYLPMEQRTGNQQGELTLPEIQRIFAEIADAGCLWLLLTGGEPFLRKDFLQIYDTAKRQGFITTIFTNGTLITEKIADYLAEWRPFSIEISLYGATQATYENVTGIPGSFSRCMQGIERLVDRGLPLKLKGVLMTLTQHELQAMQALAKSLDLSFRFDPVINAGIDGNQHPTQFRLSPENVIEIEMKDEQRAEIFPEAIEKLLNIPIDSSKLYTCGAGRSSFHIDPYGKLCLCITARTPGYDLRNHNFKECWDQLLPKLLNQDHSSSFVCSSCELRTMCPQCPAMGLVEYGNPEAQVPFLCQITHLRYNNFHNQKV
jgi:radical SAM protein with 4Fe4S-binding SPASM domain